MLPKLNYDLALAVAKDTANFQMMVNHRKAWNLDDYNLACRTLARLCPECGANARAGLNEADQCAPF